MKISGVRAAKVLGTTFLVSLLLGCSTVNSWMSSLWGNESQQTAENQTMWQDFGKSINPVRQQNAQYKKGRYFQQKKKYKLAVAEYRGVLRNNPRHIEALNAMGVTYDEMGDYFKAEMAFKAARELNDQRADIINNLGYCYLLQHKMPAAIEMFQRAVRMQETNPTYRNNLGLAYAENEQYQLAVQEFEHSKGKGQGFAYLNHVIARYGLSTRCDQYRVLAESFQGNKNIAAHQPDMSTSNVQTAAVSIEKLRTKLLRDENAAPLGAPARDTTDRATLLTSTPKKTVTPSKPATDNQPPDKSSIAIPPLAEAEIEISNGNGVNGMAHLVGNFLSRRSFPVKRLTNASRFTFNTSTIFYCPGYAHDARNVESQIPGVQQIDEVEKLGRPNIKLRVLLGNDVINKRHFFRQSIMTAEAGFLDRENRTKINTSM